MNHLAEREREKKKRREKKKKKKKEHSTEFEPGSTEGISADTLTIDSEGVSARYAKRAWGEHWVSIQVLCTVEEGVAMTDHAPMKLEKYYTC